MFKLCIFTLKNDPESISDNFKMTPESFRSNFHIIVALRDPKTIDFQLKPNKQLKVHRKYARLVDGLEHIPVETQPASSPWILCMHFMQGQN